MAIALPSHIFIAEINSQSLYKEVQGIINKGQKMSDAGKHMFDKKNNKQTVNVVTVK